MAKCAYCGTTILFGGKRDGDLRFCNQKCFQKSDVVRFAQRLPDDVVQKEAATVHQGTCPRCQGPGPVDVHVSYRVWSAIHVTQWSSRPQISCRSCGVKSKVRDMLYCLALGWWGVPWGLIMTPIQLGRNIGGLFFSADPARPSLALETMVRTNLAARINEEHQRKKVQSQ